MASLIRTLRAQFSAFDYFVLAGAAVNMLVIGYLIGYWLFTN